MTCHSYTWESLYSPPYVSLYYRCHLRSFCSLEVSETSHIRLNPSSGILMRSLLRYPSSKSAGWPFFWQHPWSVLSQTLTFHTVVPPLRGCQSCCTISFIRSFMSVHPSSVSWCVFLSGSFGAGMVAVEAVLSVPAPWSWKWFVTTVWWMCSLLPKHCATQSQTWWKQWWAPEVFMSLLQHITSY